MFDDWCWLAVGCQVVVVGCWLFGVCGMFVVVVVDDDVVVLLLYMMCVGVVDAVV